MNLSSKNLFARYYNWIYGELPNDLCSFFWGTLFASGLFLFYVPGRICNPKGTSRFWAGLGVWAAYFFLVYVGIHLLVVVWYDIPKEEFNDFLLSLSGWQVFLIAPLVSAIMFATVIGSFVGFVVGFIKVEEYYREKSETNSPTLIQNTKDIVGAIRGKYCTKINWK
jgi:uncharacterized integral membrane protein